MNVFVGVGQAHPSSRVEPKELPPVIMVGRIVTVPGPNLRKKHQESHALIARGSYRNFCADHRRVPFGC